MIKNFLKEYSFEILLPISIIAFILIGIILLPEFSKAIEYFKLLNY